MEHKEDTQRLGALFEELGLDIQVRNQLKNLANLATLAPMENLEAIFMSAQSDTVPIQNSEVENA